MCHNVLAPGCSALPSAGDSPAKEHVLIGMEKALSAFIVDKPYNNKPTGSGAWCLPSAYCLSSSRLAESSASPQLVLCAQFSKRQLGKRLLEPSPGREKSCTLLGCKHTYKLCLYLLPAIEFGLLPNYQNTGVPNASRAWPAPGASPASFLCPRGAAQVLREKSWQLLGLRGATPFYCRNCLAWKAELHSSNSQSWALSW